MTEIKQVQYELVKFSGGLIFGFRQRSGERSSRSFSWMQAMPVVPREVSSCTDPRLKAISD